MTTATPPPLLRPRPWSAALLSLATYVWPGNLPVTPRRLKAYIIGGDLQAAVLFALSGDLILAAVVFVIVSIAFSISVLAGRFEAARAERRR